MSLDEKKIKELDGYNLKKVMEFISVGNLVRGVMLGKDVVKKSCNYIYSLAQEADSESNVSNKEEKSLEENETE